MNRFLVVVLAVAGALILASSAAANVSTLERLAGPTGVWGTDQTIVYDRYDSASKSYGLVSRTPAGTVAPLNLTPDPVAPLDASVGRDANGQPVLLVTRCGKPTEPSDHCRVHVAARDGSGTERPIGGLARIGKEQGAAALSGRWLAVAGGGRGQNRIYIARLRANRARIVRSVPVPRDNGVADVAFAYPWIAVAASDKDTTISVIDARTGNQRVLGEGAIGIAGQTFEHPSFDHGWLYFTRTCVTAAAGECGALGRDRGLFRYRPATRALQQAPIPENLMGLTVLNRTLLYTQSTGGFTTADSPEDCGTGPDADPDESCLLQQSNLPTFHRAHPGWRRSH